MSPPDGSSTLTLNDPQAEEDKMRAALGLAPERAHGARPAEDGATRPGRDGGAPFTVVAARRSEGSDNARARLATLEGELKAERSERVSAQQALAEAQRVIQQLQTKLAHAEIAGTEALEAEHRARLAAEARLEGLTPAVVQKPSETPAGGKRRGRPPGVRTVVQDVEPEPVQWWLPSYAASKAKRPRSKL